VTKGKNYNSIVFLTTLSVYLGLVLVGATPEVLAQDAKKAADSNKISILAPGEGMIFTFDLNPIIELSRLAAKDASSVKIAGKLIPLQQKFTDWQIISTAGDQKILDFLRKEFFTPFVLDPPNLPVTTTELYQSVEIDKDNITFNRHTTFSNVNKAASFGETYRRVIEYARSPIAAKEIAGNLLIKHTEVRSENNQVFIVTRLPRGSIDSLLAKDAK
jgi:hypothetical protein